MVENLKEVQKGNVWYVSADNFSNELYPYYKMPIHRFCKQAKADGILREIHLTTPFYSETIYQSRQKIAFEFNGEPCLLYEHDCLRLIEHKGQVVDIEKYQPQDLLLMIKAQTALFPERKKEHMRYYKTLEQTLMGHVIE